MLLILICKLVCCIKYQIKIYMYVSLLIVCFRAKTN